MLLKTRSKDTEMPPAWEALRLEREEEGSRRTSAGGQSFNQQITR